MKYFLNKSITLKRLKWLDQNRSVFSGTGTAVGYPASIQEPSPDKIQMYEGEIGNLYFCYVDIGVPVTDGDQVVCSGVTYSVRDMKVQDFGSMQYKRLTISKGD